MTNHRRVPRVKTTIVVHISSAEAGEFFPISIARELSSGGCLVQSQTPLGVGRVLFFETVVGIKTMRMIGQVIYDYPDGHGLILNGVKFVSLFSDDVEQLDQFISDHMNASKQRQEA